MACPRKDHGERGFGMGVTDSGPEPILIGGWAELLVEDFEVPLSRLFLGRGSG